MLEARAGRVHAASMERWVHRVYSNFDTVREEPGTWTATLPMLADRRDEIADLCRRCSVTRAFPWDVRRPADAIARSIAS
jgi:hypothetical protein